MERPCLIRLSHMTYHLACFLRQTNSRAMQTRRRFEFFLLLLGYAPLLFLGRLAYANDEVYVWGNNPYGQMSIPSSASNVVALAAGDGHFLALRTDGTVIAWGVNYSGQTNVPADLAGVVGISAGSIHSLALKQDGTVTMWGRFYVGGQQFVPPTVTNVVAIAQGPGAQHAAVLRADGSIVDWGLDGYGLQNVPGGARNSIALAVGSYHTLALRADGRVVSWGDSSTVPTGATSNVVAIACGWFGNAALRADGTVVTWGQIASAPIFLGFTNVADVTCPFSGALPAILALRNNGSLVDPSGTGAPLTTNIAAINSGSYNGMALKANGPPVFPGIPVNRTVGGGMTAFFRMKPVGALPMSYQWQCNGTNVPGATNLVLAVTNVQPALSGSSYTITASNALGTATCGPMILNEVPLETYVTSTSSNALVADAVTFTAGALGRGPFSFQWQFNGYDVKWATTQTLTLTNLHLSDAGSYTVQVVNQYGAESASVSLNVFPSIVTSVPQSQTIFPGGTVNFSLALSAVIPVTYQWQFNGADIPSATGSSLVISNTAYTNAGIYTVVFNDDYETVTNTASLAAVPIAAWGGFNQTKVPAGLTNLNMISLGQGHALAISKDGTVAGWGQNYHGEVSPPLGLTNAVSVAAGNVFSVALRDDGTVVSWGNSTSGQTNVPPGLTDVIAIAAGDLHTLALKRDGTVISWGDNTHAQTNVPADATNIVAVAAGQFSSMALKSDGTVVAWGAGMTNSGTSPDYGQSVVPPGLSNVVRVATGGDHGLALRADGSIVGWGQNSYGQTMVPDGMSNVVSIAAGYGHSLALHSDGTVSAWGYSALGEITVPFGLTNVIQIAAYSFNSVALLGNPSFKFHFSPWNLTNDGQQFSFSLPTRSGKVYSLEYKTSLDDSKWTVLPLVAGTGGDV
jgi:trimeric autotransporter adhesin